MPRISPRFDEAEQDLAAIKRRLETLSEEERKLVLALVSYLLARVNRKPRPRAGGT